MVGGSLKRLLILIGIAVLGISLDQWPAAAISNIGGGTLTATIVYSNPIPPLGEPCSSTSFTLSATAVESTVTTVDPTVISGYLGEMTMSGSGQAACESTSSGSGTLTLSAQGGSSVLCQSLNGSYTRLATGFQAVVGGECSINGVTAGVSLTLQGQIVPTDEGGGVTTPITSADLVGAVAVTPA